MTIDNGSNSPGILLENVSIGSYGSSSIGVLLDEEDDELLEIELEDDEEELLIDELLEELIELLELDELELEALLEDELLEDTLLLDEVVLVSFLTLEVVVRDDSSLVVLFAEEVDSSLLVVDSWLLSLMETKLVPLETPVVQADSIKAPNRVIE